MTKFIKFLKDECGASAVEYGLMLLVATTVATAGVLALGTATGENVTAACTAVDTDASAGCP